MTYYAQTYSNAGSPGLTAPKVRLPSSPLAVLRLWIARRRQRRALMQLDAHLLSDIGVTATSAMRESKKPCWRA